MADVHEDYRDGAGEPPHGLGRAESWIVLALLGISLLSMAIHWWPRP